MWNVDHNWCRRLVFRLRECRNANQEEQCSEGVHIMWLTSPISYTCLLLAPEPAPAGEVPEVRLGAQVLAESVCSAFLRPLTVTS